MQKICISLKQQKIINPFDRDIVQGLIDKDTYVESFDHTYSMFLHDLSETYDKTRMLEYIAFINPPVKKTLCMKKVYRYALNLLPKPTEDDAIKTMFLKKIFEIKPTQDNREFLEDLYHRAAEIIETITNPRIKNCSIADAISGLHNIQDPKLYADLIHKIEHASLTPYLLEKSLWHIMSHRENPALTIMLRQLIEKILSTHIEEEYKNALTIAILEEVTLGDWYDKGYLNDPIQILERLIPTITTDIFKVEIILRLYNYYFRRKVFTRIFNFCGQKFNTIIPTINEDNAIGSLLFRLIQKLDHKKPLSFENSDTKFIISVLEYMLSKIKDPVIQKKIVEIILKTRPLRGILLNTKLCEIMLKMQISLRSRLTIKAIQYWSSIKKQGPTLCKNILPKVALISLLGIARAPYL